MEWLKSVIEWAGKHLPVPIVAFTVLVVCSGSLFFSKFLGVQLEAQQHRFIVVILFLASTAVLVAILAGHTGRAIGRLFHRWSVVRNLSQPEREMCRKLLDGGGYSLADNVGNPVMVNLQRLGILRDDVPPWQDRTDRPQPVTGFVMHSWARRAVMRKLRAERK
jgi:hypothetical protein